jgi:hypothetical protein
LKADFEWEGWKDGGMLGGGRREKSVMEEIRWKRYQNSGTLSPYIHDFIFSFLLAFLVLFVALYTRK